MAGNGVASPSAPMLEVDGLSRHFGALAALNDVSFEVRPGEIFSVIGPNGAGKSTLFNVITGLHPPTAGRVRFRGDDITGLAPEIINRRGVAKTFQITNIFPEISVVENVRVAGQSRTTVAGRLASLWRRPDVDDRVGALLDAFGLSARRDELAENLSHGEQRYLEICLALATEPTLLLLDEPTAGMTPGSVRMTSGGPSAIFLPKWSTAMRSEIPMTTLMSCSMRRSVNPRSRTMARISAVASRVSPGVIPAVGSSRSNSVGSVASARQISR